MLHYGTLLHTQPSFLEPFSPNVSRFADIVRSGMGAHLPPRQRVPLSKVVLRRYIAWPPSVSDLPGSVCSRAS